MKRVRSLGLAAILLLALSAALGACNDGGKSGGTSTPQPTATVASSTATPGGPAAHEGGADPIFWRTADNFQSVTAGAQYKIVFRITGGFAGETLVVTADRSAGGQPIEFTGNKVLPTGGDAPGSFYPVTITLPQPGRWELNVVAGDADVTIPVDVAEPGPVAG